MENHFCKIQINTKYTCRFAPQFQNYLRLAFPQREAELRVSMIFKSNLSGQAVANPDASIAQIHIRPFSCALKGRYDTIDPDFLFVRSGRICAYNLIN